MKKLIFSIAAVLFVAASCQKVDIEATVPEIKTLNEKSSQDGSYTLELNGECDCQDDKVDYYFVVGQGSVDEVINGTTETKQYTAVKDESRINGYKCILEKLIPNRTYTYYFCAKNRYGSIVRGEYMSKKTVDLSVVVETGDVIDDKTSTLIKYGMTITGIDLSDGILENNAGVTVYSDEKLTKEVCTHYYVVKKGSYFENQFVMVIDTVTNAERTASEVLYYRAFFKSPYSSETVYNGIVRTYRRLESVMEEINQSTDGLELKASSSMKPSKAVFEISQDKEFSKVISIDATVTYDEKAFYPNVYKAEATVNYSQLTVGIWYFRYCADDVISSAKYFEYVTKSTADLNKKVEELQMNLQDIQKRLASLQNGYTDLAMKKASAVESVAYLKSEGLSQGDVDNLNEELNNVDIKSIGNTISQTDKDIQNANSNLSDIAKYLSDKEYLPEYTYAYYEKNLAEQQVIIEELEKRCYVIENDTQFVEMKLAAIYSEISDTKQRIAEAKKNPQSGANSFIINSYGSHSFDASCKGNSTESVGSIASAEVLWETYGTAFTPYTGAIVSDVLLVNNIVAFKANNDGNAVIAVKDASGIVLWSWHIWVCKDYDANATAQVYNNGAGTVMDRNLGALSATKGDVLALGLLYQWGRKDPFPGSSSISSSMTAATTTGWPSGVTSDSSTGTIVYTVAHPMTYLYSNNSNNDWYYTGSSSTDDTRWRVSNKTKGLYDPCPNGWRVPDGGNDGLWAKAFPSWWMVTSSYWDYTNNGIDFTQFGESATWYPAAGSRFSSSLSLVGENGYYWSCSPYGKEAHSISLSKIGFSLSDCHFSRAYAMSVRCVKDTKVTGGNESTSEEDWIK